MSGFRAKSELSRIVTTMTIVTVLAGLMLAGAYQWLVPIIDARKLEEVRSVGMEGIFPGASSFNEVQLSEVPRGVIEPVYEVKDNTGNVMGLWFSGTTQGYGGTIRLAIGVNKTTKALIGVKVLEQQETAGLGSLIENDSFLDQFADKPLSDAFRTGADIQGLTGATVSAKAVADGASRLARSVMASLGEEIDVTLVPEEPAPSAPQAPADPRLAEVKALIDTDATVESVGLWEVKDAEGNLTAIAGIFSEKGYAGKVEVLVMVDANTHTVQTVKVLHQSETPGLGSRITDASFLKQFQGKAADDDLKVGSDIDGITMATVSSQAVANAVQRATQIVGQLYAR